MNAKEAHKRALHAGSYETKIAEALAKAHMYITRAVEKGYFETCMEILDTMVRDNVANALRKDGFMVHDNRYTQSIMIHWIDPR